MPLQRAWRLSKIREAKTKDIIKEIVDGWAESGAFTVSNNPARQAAAFFLDA